MASIRTGGVGLGEALARISKALGANPRVKAGYLENAKYPDGTSVAMVAAIQEYGAPRAGIPARPTMRPAILIGQKKWVAELAAELKANRFQGKKSLDRVGALIVGDITAQIFALNDPPLSPVTVMLRKMKRDNPALVVNRTVVAQARARVAAGDSPGNTSIKPLIEPGLQGGVMVNSLDWETLDAGE